MSNQSDFFQSQIETCSKNSIQVKQTNEISEDQKVHLKNEIKDFLKITFDAFDTDGSGNMDFREFRRLIKIMGVKMTYNEIQQIFEEFDEDDSGSIEFYEYLNLMINYFVKQKVNQKFYQRRIKKQF